MFAKLSLLRPGLCGLLFGFVASITTTAEAVFVNDVNQLWHQQGLNGFPNSTLTITNDYPDLAVIDNQNLGEEFTTFADRNDLLFANAPGTGGRRIFLTEESFDISVDLTLDATYDVRRKEAGLRINKNGFDGQFIVTTTKKPDDENGPYPDLNEIVGYGGGHPSYNFSLEDGLSYTPGTPITLRMIYRAPIGTPDAEGHFPGDYNNDGWVHTSDYTVWRDNYGAPTLTNRDPLATGSVDDDDFEFWKLNYGHRAGSIEYLVIYDGQDYTSGRLRYTNVEAGIIDESQVGVYAQGGAEPGNTDDDYTATFSNFVWGDGTIGEGAGSGIALIAHGVPEPTSFSLSVFGLTASLWLAHLRRRRA